MLAPPCLKFVAMRTPALHEVLTSPGNPAAIPRGEDLGQRLCVPPFQDGLPLQVWISIAGTREWSCPFLVQQKVRQGGEIFWILPLFPATCVRGSS